MLDPWIIEEILKKEDERRRENERSRAELPIEHNREIVDRPAATPSQEQSERGVMIIDI